MPTVAAKASITWSGRGAQVWSFELGVGSWESRAGSKGSGAISLEGDPREQKGGKEEHGQEGRGPVPECMMELTTAW